MINITGNSNNSLPTNGQATGSFDPFADLLSAQASRPRGLQTVNLRALTPFQRALLSIDGTVTKFIEAYVLEPVESLLLMPQTQPLLTEHHWLALPAQSEVIARQVLLRGRYSGTIYAYAVSLLALQRLSLALLGNLANEPAGIGRVLLNSQIENRGRFFGTDANNCPICRKRLHTTPVTNLLTAPTGLLPMAYRWYIRH